MRTTTEKSSLKIAVPNVQNIKKIIYNFSKILSFPCTLLVMKTILHILYFSVYPFLQLCDHIDILPVKDFLN